MYKLILSHRLPVLNDKDEAEEREYKFFFGIGLLYPLKHDYGLDIPDFKKLSNGKKEDFSFDQIEFMMKFLHSAHKAYCDLRDIEETLSYKQLFMAFDGEYQEGFVDFMSKGMDALMSSMTDEKNPKKPSPVLN